MADRRYTEHPNGYLNVDEHGIVFTRSGNWKEAEDAKELVTVAKVRHAGRWLIGLVLVFVAAIAHMFHGGKGYLGILIGLAALLIGSTTFLWPFRSHMSRVYRIPFAKVRHMGHTNGLLEVHFLDGEQKTDTALVQLPTDFATWVVERWHAVRTT